MRDLVEHQAAVAPVPIVILTGFLGAGKTTLLNDMIAQPEFERSALIINEIGDVGIDQMLIPEDASKPMLLAGGCICCSYSKEIGHVLRDLVARRDLGLVPVFDRVIIETTGLADPLPILNQLATDAWVSQNFLSARVVTLIDGQLLSAGHELMVEAVAQIAVADRIVMTKADLVEPHARKDAESQVAAVNPVAPIAWSGRGGMDMAFLLDRSAPLDRPAARHVTHSSGITTAAIDWEGAVDWASAAAALDAFAIRQGERLLRMKGVLSVRGVAQCVAVHSVQGIFYPPELIAGRPIQASNQLVLIGRDLDLGPIAEHLCEVLKGCRAAESRRLETMA